MTIMGSNGTKKLLFSGEVVVEEGIPEFWVEVPVIVDWSEVWEGISFGKFVIFMYVSTNACY